MKKLFCAFLLLVYVCLNSYAVYNLPQEQVKLSNNNENIINKMQMSADNTHIPAAQLERYTNNQNENVIDQTSQEINRETDVVDSLMLIIYVIASITIALYFLPTMIASVRHRNAMAIFVLNLLLGWTFLGWVGALVWACCNPEDRKIIIQNNTEQNVVPFTDELEKLADLRERGIITEEEFNIKKSQILNL